MFRKVTHCKMSHSSSGNLYSRCWVDFASNAVGTKAPHFVDLGLPYVNTLDEVNILGTPTTRIEKPADISHWSAPDHIFCEATVVGMITTRLELDYSYKTDIHNLRENQDFGRQIFQ